MRPALFVLMLAAFPRSAVAVNPPTGKNGGAVPLGGRAAMGMNFNADGSIEQVPPNSGLVF
jgi:hypothetical protein